LKQELGDELDPWYVGLMVRMVLLTLAAAVFVGCASVKNAARLEVTLVPDKTVEEVLRYADEWGIPQPPEDSELVMLMDSPMDAPDASLDYPDLDAISIPRDVAPNSGVPVLDAMGNPIVRLKDSDGNPLPQPDWGIPFELGFRSASSSNKIYLGFSQIDLGEYGDLVATDRGTIVVDWLKIIFMHGGVAHSYNCALITAVQILRRDPDSMIGRAVLSRASRDDELARVAALEVDHPVARLGRAALLNEINQITTPTADFRRIKSNIEKIWKTLGPYTTEVVMGTPRIPKLIHQLELTVNHPKPETGSVEAIIERYLFSGGKTFPIMGRHGEGGSAKAWEDLVLAGFDAVPVLIKLLDDDRVTNHLMQGFNNFVSHPMRVSQVASSYLRRFAGSDLGKDWLSTQQGYSAKAKIVREWHEEARKQGEDKYVAEYCLTKTENNIHVNAALLLIAERRHPNLLRGFYRRMLQEASHSHHVAEAIATAPGLARGTKIELFKEGVATQNNAHVRAAKSAWQKLLGN
jgi:hypothetical protein